ncbi:uncharacterized protein [Coffea arabica]|uniref:Transposase MuDR plant domain-containing protein n=1 Tax=Coffea arabica TaxID=13443 RepID=A0ABM4X756_COFAR
MVEIHLYFGGIFRSEPNTAYVGNYKLAIWKDKDPNELSIVGLWNDDIKLMNDAHLHLPVRVANANHTCEETTDKAESAVDKAGKSKNVEPNWLDKGLESIEDEDIFAVNPSKKEAAMSKLHVFALKGDLNSPKKLVARDQPTIEERETLAKYYSTCSRLQDSGNHVQQQPKEDFDGLNSEVRLETNWNEPVIPDEELLERTGSNGEKLEEYLDFDPKVEFNKPHFELKMGQKFKNFRLFRVALLEWNIRDGYETKWIRNDFYRIRAECERGCS